MLQNKPQQNDLIFKISFVIVKITSYHEKERELEHFLATHHYGRYNQSDYLSPYTT